MKTNSSSQMFWIWRTRLTAAIFLLIAGVGCVTPMTKPEADKKTRAIEFKEMEIQSIQSRISSLRQDLRDFKSSLEASLPKDAARIEWQAESSLNKEYSYEDQLKDLIRIEDLLKRRMNYLSNLRQNMDKILTVIDTR